MRAIIYKVINKNTNTQVYGNCRASKCEEFLANLPNKEDYAIVYKWHSI
jgi:hypothetical protein